MVNLNSISEEDIIVLLYGWWAKNWAMGFLKDVLELYPAINFEYLDGPFGEEKRKNLKSESISNRYDILDL